MTVTGIISAIIVGAPGRLVVPGRQNIGILVTMGVGVVAARRRSRRCDDSPARRRSDDDGCILANQTNGELAPI